MTALTKALDRQLPMIRGVHTMFYSSKPDEFRAFVRDKLGFTS